MTAATEAIAGQQGDQERRTPSKQSSGATTQASVRRLQPDHDAR
jgi:hypothetical protein